MRRGDRALEEGSSLDRWWVIKGGSAEMKRNVDMKVVEQTYFK
jgi:hypothetical protein